MSHNENKAVRLVQWLSDQAIDGVRPLSSARDLADEYLLDRGYKTNGARVDALSAFVVATAGELDRRYRRDGDLASRFLLRIGAMDSIA
jgi:hypothetical protein